MRTLVLSLLMLSVTCVWGWTFVVVHDAVHRWAVVPFLAVRFAIGAAVLATWSTRRLTPRCALTGAGIGLVLGGAYLAQTLGLRGTTPTKSGLITGLFVLFAPLANRLLFGVKTRPAVWQAICVSVIGLAMLQGADLTRPSTGDLVTLLCAALFGLHIAMLDRYAKQHDASALAFAQITTAAVAFFLVWPISGPIAVPPREVWGALLITGVLATAGGFGVQTYVQRRLSAVRTAVILTMEPVFATLFGILLAGDRLTLVQIFGATLMVVAMLIAEVLPNGAPPTNTPAS